MKHAELRDQTSRRRRFTFFFILNFTCFIFAARGVEEFGDITVEPGAIYTGNTFHGYAEMRVVMENHSRTKTHYVTLTYPNRSYGSYGNTITRITRSAKLEPEAQVVVSLLQPPLPAQGDNQIHVEIDGRAEGETHAPNANNHMGFGYGGNKSAVVFVSRGLDFDEVNLLMQPEFISTPAAGGGITNSAVNAAGEPRAFASGRKDLSQAWMPNWRLPRGTPHWLEVDYAPTQTVEKLLVHSVQAPLRSGSITLTGVSGAKLLTLPLSSASHGPNFGKGWNLEFKFPKTPEAVKTVRIDFGATPAHSIAIDGVQISGPGGDQWATNARASSEYNSSTTSPATYYPSGGRSGMENVTCLRAESAVADWSENWLAYTPFDLIALNATDLAGMSPAVLNAIGDYLQTGGNVLVFGRSDLPDAWRPTEKKPLADGVKFQAGFGCAFAVPTENPAGIDAQTIKSLRDLTRDSSVYWQNMPDETGANNALPVVENLKIPTRGIVVIMLAFIILIGPVNLVYLSRKKKRTWMLWTIPAISFATTLLVFIYSLLREGITPDTRIAGLTVLDQAAHHASTIGATAFYCPLTPSGGLKFDYETEATPLVGLDYGPGMAREVEWSQGQHLSRGWVSARVPAHFHLRKPETRRERVQVVDENGKRQIINSLGAQIKVFWLADANGKIYRADNIPAGQKAPLLPSQYSLSKQLGAAGLWHDVGFTLASGRGADLSLAGTEEYLLPNTYLAMLDGNPFIENALGAAAGANRTKASSVVFGILEPESK